MKPKLLAIIVANLFVAVPVAQAAGLDWSGSSISIGGQHVSDKAQDPSKLNEYRDLDSSVLGGFEARGRGDKYYLNAYGENLGRDDMYLNLSGGQYGVFKYRVYDDEMRHNFGSGVGARSPYAGIGGPNLTDPAGLLGTTNVGAWNYFDHSYKRRDWGGMFEFQTQSPWYFRAEAKEVKRDGINVFAGALGTSPGQGGTDLPAPIDYTTRDASIEAGYSAKRGHFAINVMQSKFDNGNRALNWTQLGASPPSVPAGTDTTILAPDNDMWRLAANGNLRGLPGDSTLAGRFTYSKLKSDEAIPAANLWGNTGYPGGTVFNGKIEKTTLSLSYASHPMTALDTKLYYNWVDDKNKSNHLDFIGSTGGLSNCAPLCAPHNFAYEKHNIGGEASYRFNRENKLTGGYDWLDVDRDRVDFHKSTDNKLFVEWKSSSLENLTGRIKYQYLQTRSDWYVAPAVIAANPLEEYVRRYDLANKDQNLVKIVLDATPAPMVDVGFEAIYKDNEYKDTLLGRTGDTRNEYYASVSFGDPKKVRALIFGDIEFLKIKSFHRVGTGNPDPSTPPTGSTYNWHATNSDRSWQIGLGLDFVPMNRLTVKSSLIYAETKGTADFTVQQGGSTAPRPPIPNFDNTTRKSLNIKGIYDYSKQWEFSGGFAYEKYKYSDIGYDNTQYVIPNGNTARYTYFTGQYSFQPYSANIFYATAKYKF